MILTVLKNLVSTPATRQYPFTDIREPVAGFRGKIALDVSKCKLCGACARLCPAKAIEVNRQTREVTYAPFNCIYCGTCAEGCPTDAIIQTVRYAPPAPDKLTEIIDIPVPAPVPKAGSPASASSEVPPAR